LFQADKRKKRKESSHRDKGNGEKEKKIFKENVVCR
jgi:hypothetical protein